MALDRHDYDDPMLVLERKQERQARALAACGDCVHHVTMPMGGETFHGCALKRGRFGNPNCNFKQIKVVRHG